MINRSKFGEDKKKIRKTVSLLQPMHGEYRAHKINSNLT